jgi:hypothetical protein
MICGSRIYRCWKALATRAAAGASAGIDAVLKLRCRWR